MREKVLNLLGLATRAGLLVSGEDIVIDAMRKKKAKIVFGIIFRNFDVILDTLY